MIITLANGKGGSGKTTLAVLLAHALAESGKAVSVLDLDPQGTATNWLRESGSKVAMYDPARKYDAVFIDTPPRVEALRAEGVRVLKGNRYAPARRGAAGSTRPRRALFFAVLSATRP